MPRKKKLKTDAEKTAEKAQHLRFGKAELTPDKDAGEGDGHFYFEKDAQFHFISANQ